MKRTICVLVGLVVLTSINQTISSAGGAGDEKAIQGTWKLVSVHLVLNKKVSEDDGFSKEATLTFQDGKVTSANFNPGEKDEGAFKIYPDKTPKQIDLHSKKSPKVLGLYQLQGDTLKLARKAADGLPRPNSFADDMIYILTFKRVKSK